MYPHGDSRAWQPGPSPRSWTAGAAPVLSIRHFPGDRDGGGQRRRATGHQPEGGVRSTPVSACCQAGGMAVAQLKWQRWDNPALNWTFTVTVLQRLRAQVYFFLMGLLRKESVECEITSIPPSLGDLQERASTPSPVNGYYSPRRTVCVTEVRTTLVLEEFWSMNLTPM